MNQSKFSPLIIHVIFKVSFIHIPNLLHPPKRDLFATSSLKRLQLKGKCLLKLKISSRSTGLYGRTIVVLQTAVHGKIINTQHFSSGK